MTSRLPYCGPAPVPETLLAQWNVDLLPIVLIAAVFSASLYMHRGNPIGGKPQLSAFIAAAGLAIAFISPLCALSAALFSARTAHHLVLVCLVAPALALAFRHIRLPAVAGGTGLAAVSIMLWAWHIPALYTAAWNSHAVYWGMQLALIGAAWAFWSGVFSLNSGSSRFQATLLVAALAGQMGLIGAILVFSRNILYSEHILLTDVFGISAIGDQQLAGLVMWVPGMAPLALIAALLLHRGWREVSAA